MTIFSTGADTSRALGSLRARHGLFSISLPLHIVFFLAAAAWVGPRPQTASTFQPPKLVAFATHPVARQVVRAITAAADTPLPNVDAVAPVGFDDVTPEVTAAAAQRVVMGEFELDSVPGMDTPFAPVGSAGFDVAAPLVEAQGMGGGVTKTALVDGGGFSAGEGVDEPATLLAYPTPHYTEEARRHRTRGVVRLEVRLLRTGSIRVVRTLASLDHGLTQAAIDAVERATCRPARKSGSPIDVSAIINVVFEIA